MAEKVPDPKQLVCDALNEHGFLLQQVVRKKLEGWLQDDKDPLEKWKDTWRFVAAEYPVTAADNAQTRIDLLLRHRHAAGVYMCMECKRPNPKYKKWVFFDRESNVAGMQDGQLSLETVFISHRTTDPAGMQRRLSRVANVKQVPTFAYYLEAAVKRDGSVSSTETIEKAFCQLMKAHSGLMAKFECSNDLGHFRSIPVLVTTAELYEAKFEPKRVNVETGMIAVADVELNPVAYCAVNYRADDNLALRALTPHERSVGINDLINSQIRTIFVVRTTTLHTFLNWASENLINPV